MRRIGIIAALGLVGCATMPPGEGPITGTAPDGTPRWVRRGSVAADGSHGKAFYGVGVVQGIRNIGLARQAADNRARAEIARVFHTYVAALMRDYQRSTTAGDMKRSSEEQDVVSAQRTLTEATLRGVTIEDHWTDPRSGALYALAVLRLDQVSKALQRAAGLQAGVRDFVRRNAARAFDQLDRAVARRHAAEGGAPRAEGAPPVEEAPREEAPPEAPREERARPPEEAPPAEAAPRGEPRQIRLGLKVRGHQGRRVQTCLAGKLIEQGFAVYEGTSDVDVYVKGQIATRPVGRTGGTRMVETTATMQVLALDDGRVLASVERTIRVGRPTLAAAAQLAIARVCARVVPDLAAAVRKAVAGQ